MLNIATETANKPVDLKKTSIYVCCCNAGISRSQVAAAMLEKMGLQVNGILAGRDSAMNPDVDCHTLCDPLEVGQDAYGAATNFATCFGTPKHKQIGTEQGDFLEADEAVKAKKFYQNYIDQLSNVHLITFGESISGVMKRVLQKKETLKGITITYCPIGDEIARPAERSGAKKYNVEAYQSYSLIS